MRFGRLPYRNIIEYRRYYRLAALAVVIAAGVVTGSLMVGDSVRMTLVKRVAERLGDTETVIFSRSSFMDEGLAGRVSAAGDSRGILLCDGFVSRGGRLIPVTVWGTDDMSVARGTARVNPSLAEELGAGDAEDIVLRLPSGGLVPPGSLFVTRNYTTSLRLSPGGTVGADEGGNISMKNEQTRPLNIFVERAQLAQALGAEGKINLILSDGQIDEEGFAGIWDPADSGLTTGREEGFTAITSDRIFLQQDVVENVVSRYPSANRLFSYLVNSISSGKEAIPYSFATALDSYGGRPLAPDEAIVSDYTARRLGLRTGDTVTLEWFVAGEMKTLSTEGITLTVGEIVPLSELAADGGLSADFPGLSDVERCTDWDSDLPMDMGLVTDEDEKYWELWRDTPKIVVPYGAVARSWGNEYGTATAVRVGDPRPDLSALNHGMFGIEVIHPREAAMAAARGGVDFSSLFLALGCFIVASAMLLATMPLSEMLHKRRREFGTMTALGFTARRITRMVWREAAPLVLLSALAGTLAGILYTALVMWLLGSVWRGATHTGGFSVEVGAAALAVGFAVGVAAALLPIRSAIRKGLRTRERAPEERACAASLRRKKRLATAASAMVAAAVAVNLLLFDSVAFFVVTGAVSIAAAVLWGEVFVRDRAGVQNGALHRSTLAPIAIAASRSRAMRSLAALSAGVFVVFSVGLNRKGFTDPSQIRTGTGGYTLWCESSVPIYHNLATDEGREALALADLPPGTRFLQCLRYGADDASCLNLNRVSAPTVLGVDMRALPRSDFELSGSLREAGSFVAFADRMGRAYPALVDETVLKWSLGKSLGDTLHYRGGGGGEVAIVLTGTLSNSVFQGNILIDRTLMGEIWPEIAGSEVFLAETTPEEAEPTRDLLSRALAEYGVRVSATSDRLREFNSVTDTYLNIFFTLGALGLLLGMVSFIVAVRKNLAARSEEIRLFRAMGYTRDLAVELLYRENVMIPLYAIPVGVGGAILGVAGGFADTGPGMWLSAAAFTALFILCIVWFVKRLCIKEVDDAFFTK